MKLPVLIPVVLLLTLVLPACRPVSETFELSPQPDAALLKPGDTIGPMRVIRAQNESMDLSIFNFCDPYLGSQPVVLTFECQVPQSDYLFIGYGEIANSNEELDKKWGLKTWKLSIDGNPVDLPAFGTLDADLGRKIRVWNIALEGISPGSHVLRYEARDIVNPQNLTDLTWLFTMLDQTVASPATTSPAPTPSAVPGVYPALSSTIQVGLNPYRSETTDLNFMFYVPSGYQKDHQQKMPLVLYLHGTSLRGDNLDKLRIGEFTAILQYKLDFPFLVAAPQLPANDENRSWSRGEMPEKLFRLLDEIQAIYSVDAKRIYLTGSSLGGGGTWEIGLRYPDYFAALVPVMGFYGYPFEVPDNICDLKDVPVWAFHGESDLTVPLAAEQGLVEALRACGGDVQFTIYPGAGHNVESQVYKTPELYEWMLAQSLE